MKIRKARPGDEHEIIDLIIELAVFEKEPDSVINTPANLAKDLFKNQLCECTVVEENGSLIAYAIYYTSYSTWNGACLYLEDIYVTTNKRGSGVGKALFGHVVEIAKERKVKRMDWQVLKWNTDAIHFYEREGATIDEDWYNGRLFF